MFAPKGVCGGGELDRRYVCEIMRGGGEGGAQSRERVSEPATHVKHVGDVGVGEGGKVSEQRDGERHLCAAGRVLERAGRVLHEPYTRWWLERSVERRDVSSRYVAGHKCEVLPGTQLGVRQGPALGRIERLDVERVKVLSTPARRAMSSSASTPAKSECSSWTLGGSALIGGAQ